MVYAGGELLSFILHTYAWAQHLLFTKNKITGISSTPKQFFETFATQKNNPILYIYQKTRP